ncbi:MAG TPA: hypothetical protein VEX38_05610 [Fimbriimonadaceae bacterium]|nr:hypothetical protein [Fimbriimonadaceae bacterium]
MRRSSRRTSAGLVLLGLVASARPVNPEFYGDYRSVSAIALLPRGGVAIASKGGLLTWQPGGPLKSYGWRGLIGTRGPEDVWERGGSVLASTGERVAALEKSGLSLLPQEVPRRQGVIEVTPEGLVSPERPTWPGAPGPELVPTKEITGTHVSALAVDRGKLLAAWYGDGLWRHDGRSWSRAPEPPGRLPQVRALAWKDGRIAAATFDGDLHVFQGSKWTKLPRPNLPQGSIYSMEKLGEMVFAGSFEDGLSYWDRGKWTTIKPPTLSSPHARHMAVFQNRLYVRQTTGEVDRFDGTKWTKNIFPWLLRGAATCLGSGAGKLLVGQWGGWSEFDGVRWTHHLKLPELQGFVVTALGARKGEVWIGSQEHGLFRHREGRPLSAFDQRHGLGNDWVRNILCDGENLVVGMFLTGAYRMGGDQFERLTPEVRGEATALVRQPGTNVLFFGTREGLWKIDGAAAKVQVGGLAQLEVQSLLSTPEHLWIGTPNGVARISWAQLKRENK